MPSDSEHPKSHRGFASMDASRQKEIASKGGRAAHSQGRAHEFTPDEARKFLGLPDVAPLQESMMAQMRAQMEKAAAAMDPDAIMKALDVVKVGRRDDWLGGNAERGGAFPGRLRQ